MSNRFRSSALSASVAKCSAETRRAASSSGIRLFSLSIRHAWSPMGGCLAGVRSFMGTMTDGDIDSVTHFCVSNGHLALDNISERLKPKITVSVPAFR